MTGSTPCATASDGVAAGVDALRSLIDDPSPSAAGFDDLADAVPELWPAATALGVLARIAGDGDGADVAAPLTRLAERGADGAALEIVERLPVTTRVRATQVALSSAARRDTDVLALTHGIEAVDDVTALMLVYRATALARQGLEAAAREAVAPVLRSRRRHPGIRAFARHQRETAWSRQPIT